MNPQDDIYDYTTAGFDDFLSRSVDNVSQANLDSAGPRSTAVRFDGAQISGALGDTFRIGSIFLDGAKGRITILDDDGNTVVILGELDG